MRLDFDAVHGQAKAAEFETRLFRQVALCHSGSFPTARAVAVEVGTDGSHTVTNVGTRAWPAGVLLAGRRVHGLPALAPGARTTIVAAAGAPPQDAVTRTAMSRTPVDGEAVLWNLELAGVADAAIESSAWLLVTAARP
jgi:hypothetical protein